MEPAPATQMPISKPANSGPRSGMGKTDPGMSTSMGSSHMGP